MGLCPACGVHVQDKTDVCPLCRHALIKEEGGQVPQPIYPDISREIRKYVVVFRVFLFVGVMISAISLFVNYHTSHRVWWSAIVVAVMAYLVGMLAMFLWDAGYLRRIFFGFLGAVGVIVVTDAVLGFRRWSVNYGFPAIIILLDVTLAALMIFNRKRWESYLVFLILVILLGLIPLVLTALHIVTRPLLSDIALITAGLVFIGSLILGGQAARSELHRRFHI